MTTAFLAATFPNTNLDKPAYAHGVALQMVVRVYESIAIAATAGATRDEILNLLVPEDSDLFLIDQILANGDHLGHLRMEDDRYFYIGTPQITAGYLNNLPDFHQQ